MGSLLLICSLLEVYFLQTVQPQSGCIVCSSSEEALSRRQLVLGCCRISLVSGLMLNCVIRPSPARAGEESNAQEEDKDDEGVIGAIKSIFDPNEKTKSGKVLPKAYLKSAREMVKTLRDSLKEDPKDIVNFRRNADAAKESIRDYLNNWRGQKTVENEVTFFEILVVLKAKDTVYFTECIFVILVYL